MNSKANKTGLVRAGDTDLLRDIVSSELSPAAEKLLDAAAAIRLEPDAVERAYLARQLVLCTLPHSNPGDVPAWGRTHGNFAFAIQPGVDAFTHKSIGIPYGTIPRLLLYWVCTEAVQKKSPVLELGDTLSDFMRELGLSPNSGGGKRSGARKLKEQAMRLFSATITFQNKVPATRLDMKIGRAQLWWTPRHPDQAALWGSSIELTAEFFQAITAAPIPLDTRALRALKRSPLALDVYGLLSYRAFIASRKRVAQYVTWDELRRQFGADYGNAKDFRKKVSATLGKIQQVLPRLLIARTPGGLTILPGSQPAIAPKG